MKPPFNSVEECFYGSATLGERGQIVIPADARKDCDIHPGDKLLVFRHPIHPNMLMLAKVSEMQLMLEQMTKSLAEIGTHIQEAANADSKE